MDSLTQIVLGGAVGELVLGKKVGNKAILWGAIAGTIPDLDVVASFFVDRLRANEVHRGFSHSIVFAILFAPIFGWIISKIYKNLKEVDWKDWSKLMFWGLFTHPLLDIHTTWGTQLLWPLEYKFAFKNIFVVDPLYTLPFLVCLILVMRSTRGSDKRRKYNRLGLLLSSGYLLITFGLKAYAHSQFENSLNKQRIAFQELSTKPAPFNTILWSANVKTENQFLIGYYSLLDQNNDILFTGFDKNYHLANQIRQEDKFKRLEKLTQGWYTLEQFGDTIRFNDLRFGQDGIDADANQFIFCYDLYYQNNELIVEERPREFNGGMMEMMGKLINRIGGK